MKGAMKMSKLNDFENKPRNCAIAHIEQNTPFPTLFPKRHLLQISQQLLNITIYPLEDFT